MKNQMKLGITTLFILALAFGSIATASAANNNVYVNTTGNDITGNGTLGNPYATIQTGINKAPVGGTVYIAPGTYTGTGNSILKVKNNLTITGLDSATTIQDGGNVNESFIIYKGATVTIQNMTLRNFDQELGGAITNLGILTLKNIRFIGDTATNTPGISSIDNRGTLTEINDTYSGYTNDTGGKPAGWNDQQLASFDHNKTSYTFLFEGDSRNDMGNLASMINAQNAEKNVLFNIFAGDLRDVSNPLYAFKKIYLAPSNYTHWNMPILFAPGNHETYNDPNVEAIYKNLFGNATYFSWTVGNSYFIMLDNDIGSVDKTQFAWLQDQLQQSLKYKNLFIFAHIPLWTPADQTPHSMQVGDTNTTIGATTLNNLLDQYPVTMLFTSHIHNYYTGTWGKTPFIISGDAGAPSYLGKTNGTVTNPSHRDYIRVTVTPKGVLIKNVKYPAVANNYDFTTPPL